MNLRHAAALALVGWYLLVPPHGPNGRWDPRAPLSKWVMDGSYDTAKECDARYHRDLDLALDMKRKHLSPPDIFDEVRAEECIAADDPRLAK